MIYKVDGVTIEEYKRHRVVRRHNYNIQLWLTFEEQQLFNTLSVEEIKTYLEENPVRAWHFGYRWWLRPTSKVYITSYEEMRERKRKRLERRIERRINKLKNL